MSNFYKRIFIIFLVTALYMMAAEATLAQDNPGFKKQLRIYVDEDYLNIRGEGTDKGYTSGLQFSLLFRKDRPGFFLDHIFPKAGTGAINANSISLAYLVFTPSDLSSTVPLKNDYPYSAAILADYGLQSYNSQKKYNIQSSIIIGAMGPFSGAKDVQQSIHRLIKDEVPAGWDNQLQNDILINLQVAAEKGIFSLGNILEAVAGGKIAAGSLLDQLETYGILRFGKMNPYFSGVISQRGSVSGPATHGNRWQLYAFAKPAAQLVAYNALMQGGIILHKDNVYTAGINRLNTYFNYGLTLVYHNFSASFTQKAFSSLVKDLKSQETGNITISFSW